jgi:hypothetical protein
MTGEDLGAFIRTYLARAVNERDITAIEDMVSPGYQGSGRDWPPDLASLREFYQWQARMRPDWRVEVQETIEVGEWVAVRALAGGTVAHDDPGKPVAASVRMVLEWLTLYHVVDRKIAEIRVIAVVEGRAN